MKCPKCDAKMKGNLNRCNQCGQDISMFQYLSRLSNAYYNIALEKAQVRDLSGAIATLRKSLEFNKHNTDSRNLLGLVLNEMGETAGALSEWVISKYLQQEENKADYFINKVQKNPSGLETINQTIKKYNAALNSAKTGNGDLAIIQLKKAVSLNPRFVRAQQLLALLYIKNRDYQKAYKCLRQARSIDYSNTTTLRYMMEVGEQKEPTPRERKNAAAERPTKNSLVNVTPVGSYREERRSWIPFLNVIIGILVGVMVSLFLLRPTIIRRLESTTSDTAAMRSEITNKEMELVKAGEEKTELKDEIKKLQKEVNKGKTEQSKTVKAYEQLVKGVSLYQENKRAEAAICVSEYKASDYKLSEAKTLFHLISKTLSEEELSSLFETGKDQYNAGKYDEAIQNLEAVLAIDEEHQDALYFMGRVSHRKNDKAKAEEYYGKALAVDATTSRANEAKSRLRELGVREADIEEYSQTAR